MTDRAFNKHAAWTDTGNNVRALWRKLSHRYEAHGPLGFAGYCWAFVLRQAHTQLLDPHYLTHEVIPTSDVIPLDELTIIGENAAHGVRHEASPRLCITWLYDLLPADLSNWCLIDIGAGRGRVVLDCAKRPFAKVIAVEFAEETCAALRSNLLALRPDEVQAGSIEVRHQDATSMTMPPIPSIFYLFNPFDECVLHAFIDRLTESYRRNPRPIIIAHLSPRASSVLRISQMLIKWRLPLISRLKYRLLSQHRLELFVTSEALEHLG